jgi:hypothetical protein
MGLLLLIGLAAVPAGAADSNTSPHCAQGPLEFGVEPSQSPAVTRPTSSRRSIPNRLTRLRRSHGGLNAPRT